MAHIDKKTQLFLSVIRETLFGDISTITVPKDVDALQVLDIAKEQAMQGITGYGLVNARWESRPDRITVGKLVGAYENAKKKNQKVNSTLRALLQELDAAGITPLIVKGQVVAQEYGSLAYYRMSGDIDFFCHSNQWERLQQWVNSLGVHVTSTSAEKHIEFDYRDIPIEPHHNLQVFSTKREQTYWQNVEENELLPHHRSVQIEDFAVPTLSIEDTIVHLLMHIIHHLLTEGVGLRQLCDFAMFLKNHAAEVNEDILCQRLAGISHERAFSVMLAFCEKHLGMTPKFQRLSPRKADFRYADRLLRTALSGGNHGHKNNLKGVEMGLLHSMNTARLVFSHAILFYPLASKECRSYWWSKIFWRRKRKR